MEQIPCELHQKMKNLSIPCALRYALPCPPGTKWHTREIPPGSAKVRVDEILTGFDSMELDIHGAEGERTLGEMKGGIILWDKENIKFPAGSAPWTTAPPPSHRRSPSPPSPRRSPPHDYDHHSASPSRSPLPDLGRASSPPPPPAKRSEERRVGKECRL